MSAASSSSSSGSRTFHTPVRTAAQQYAARTRIEQLGRAAPVANRRRARTMDEAMRDIADAFEEDGPVRVRRTIAQPPGGAMAVSAAAEATSVVVRERRERMTVRVFLHPEPSDCPSALFTDASHLVNVEFSERNYESPPAVGDETAPRIRELFDVFGLAESQRYPIHCVMAVPQGVAQDTVYMVSYPTASNQTLTQFIQNACDAKHRDWGDFERDLTEFHIHLMREIAYQDYSFVMYNLIAGGCSLFTRWMQDGDKLTRARAQLAEQGDVTAHCTRLLADAQRHLVDAQRTLEEHARVIAAQRESNA